MIYHGPTMRPDYSRDIIGEPRKQLVGAVKFIGVKYDELFAAIPLNEKFSDTLQNLLFIDHSSPNI